MYTARCHPGCTTRFDNRFDNRLYRVNKHTTGFGIDNWLDVCLHDTAGCQIGCTTVLTTGCMIV